MEKSTLVLIELEVVQSEIARFDGNGLKVKEWTLLIWAGLVAYGVQHQKIVIILSSLISTLSFALVELAYRRFQSRFIVRSGKIEQLLVTGDLEGYEYQIHRCAIGEIGDCRLRDEVPRILKQPHFTLFYLILAVFSAGIILYMLGRPLI